MPHEYSTDDQLDRSTNTWMMVGVALLVLMAAMFPLYRWFEPGARADSREAQAASLAAEGETIWQFNCASCHGFDGGGGVASGAELRSSTCSRPPTTRPARSSRSGFRAVR